ncbi:hypothetical protein AB5I41_23035 [Sphingomonas sp. MMS24-JH45]
MRRSARVPAWLAQHLLLAMAALALAVGLALPSACSRRGGPASAVSCWGSPASSRRSPALRCSRSSIPCCCGSAGCPRSASCWRCSR